MPVAILIVLGTAGFLILGNPPEINRDREPDGPRIVVETRQLIPNNYAMRIQSYGTVAPRTQSMLVAQVGGQIVSVEPSFRPGGFFDQGDVLLKIDPRDYDADVKIAEATLLDALQAEAQEEARAEQAMIDWERLGGNEQPSDLVLRKPQLQAARARVASARSALTKAELDLERTELRAPFDGRVLRKLVDVGQVVNGGAQLAEVYATDYVEIRLPIGNSDLPFVDLPETEGAHQPSVTLASELGGEVSWSGTIVRTEGAIDASSQQLHVVAQVNDPFSTERGTRPIKIGEYVTAVIDGRLLTDRLVIPSDAIYQNSYVYVVEEGLLRRRDVTVAWQNGIDAIIKDGLLAGEELVTTPLGQVTSGTRVRVALPSGTGEGEAAIRRPHGDWHKASSIPQGGGP